MARSTLPAAKLSCMLQSPTTAAGEGLTSRRKNYSEADQTFESSDNSTAVTQCHRKVTGETTGSGNPWAGGIPHQKLVGVYFASIKEPTQSCLLPAAEHNTQRFLTASQIHSHPGTCDQVLNSVCALKVAGILLFSHISYNIQSAAKKPNANFKKYKIKTP